MTLSAAELYLVSPSTDSAAMIRTRGRGDLMAGLGGKKGCCGTPSGWAEYSARVKIPLGLLTSEVLEHIACAAREFGRGEVFLTARLGMEIPGISEERFPLLQERLAGAGVSMAGCGPRMRSVVSCKGSVCVHGNIDTFGLAWEIDRAFNRAEKLPHKFKVAVAGCASTCSKPELNDIGLVGVYRPNIDEEECDGCGRCIQACHLDAIELVEGVALVNSQHCVDCGDCARACPSSAIMPIRGGVNLFAGGRWGRRKQVGVLLARFLTIEEAKEVTGKVLDWYRANGHHRERLGAAMLRCGTRAFQTAVLAGIDARKQHQISPEEEAAFELLR